MKTVIEVRNLNKNYSLKKHQILNNISFSVLKGEVFGLLGPNGAGKTTTIKILTTLLTPSSGEVFVLGKDIKKYEKNIRKDINFVFGGEKGVYTQLTANEYLTYFCILYNIPPKEYQLKIPSLIKLVGLEEASNKKISTFSKGMIQRLHIARSLINDPKIIFLDEPTIGLDPIGAKMLRNLVKSLSNKGITIFLTTHYMQEAEELCDKIAFIKKGQIIEFGKTGYLIQKYNYFNVYESTIILKDKNELLKNKIFSNIEIKEIKDNYIFLKFNSKEKSIENIKSELSKYCIILDLKKKQITLEDIYIELMEERG